MTPLPAFSQIWRSLLALAFGCVALAGMFLWAAGSGLFKPRKMGAMGV